MDRSPLSSINQKLIEVGAYLSEFRDERKVHCLKVFVECMEFVTWIRSCTTGKNWLSDVPRVDQDKSLNSHTQA